MKDELKYVSGRLYWKEWRIGIRRNLLAGTVNKKGYRSICFPGGVFEYAHRIVWKIHYGNIPEGMDVDHINHERDDNRIENLRLVTRQDNLRNKGVVSSNTGVMGVYWNKKTNRYTANITINKKTKHLGTFMTLDAAAKARKEAERLYGFHENHGSNSTFCKTRVPLTVYHSRRQLRSLL